MGRSERVEIRSPETSLRRAIEATQPRKGDESMATNNENLQQTLPFGTN